MPRNKQHQTDDQSENGRLVRYHCKPLPASDDLWITPHQLRMLQETRDKQQDDDSIHVANMRRVCCI